MSDIIDTACATMDEAIAELTRLRAEVAALKTWVSDLQSGMYINCVYCGHRYGPDPGRMTPTAMADVLRRHIEQCPKHPLSAALRERDDARRERDQARRALAEAQTALNTWLAQYAGDLCGPEHVKDALGRLSGRGTIAYIAEVSAVISAALSPSPPEPQEKADG